MRIGDLDGYGRYGMLDTDGERILCHECGQWKKSVGAHLASHGMTAVEYRERHGLARGTPLVAPATSARVSQLSRERIGSEAFCGMNPPQTGPVRDMLPCATGVRRTVRLVDSMECRARR